MRNILTSGRGNPLRLVMQSVPVPWVFVLAYVCGIGLEYVVPTPPAIKALAAIRLAGGGLFVAGAALAGWGWETFRRARTTTVPGQASSRLVTWGPYRFSRNPMYVGLSVAYVGEAGMLAQVWPLVLLPVVIVYLTWVVIPVEERKLTPSMLSTNASFAPQLTLLGFAGRKHISIEKLHRPCQENASNVVSYGTI